jgi:uncharacterized protein (TIGR02001 family)
MNTTSLSKLALVAAAAVVSGNVLAQTAAPAAAPAAAKAPEPDYTFTGNLGVFSDYRFRGVSQTNKNPAIQGGVDFAMKNGFYLGNWNSNVDSAQYTGANIEMDFYGGYKATFGDFGLDLGAIYYYYPGSGNNGSTKINNTELYIGGSWGPLTAKYSYAVSDFFSAPNSSGSYYFNVGAAHDFGNGFGVNASIGYQGLKGGAVVTQINGSVADSITDYKIGGTYTIDGWALGLAYVGTNRDLAGYTSPSKNISNGTALVSVSKSF